MELPSPTTYKPLENHPKYKTFPHPSKATKKEEENIQYA
jgi:hypothetical protein